MVHCNVNGLSNKVHILRDALNMSNNVNLLLVSETHLTCSISDATISIPGYQVFRNDRASNKHGVCVYVEETIAVDSCDITHPNVLFLKLSSFDVYVCVVYRPPSYSPDENTALLDFLLNNFSNKEAVIMGDFNLPTLYWDHLFQTLGATSLADNRFIDLFITLGLTQWITEPTFPRSGNILDLILTTEHDRVGEVRVQPPPPGCDHCSIHCTYVFDKDVELPSHSDERLMWHRGRYDDISNALLEVDWDFEFAYLTSDEALVKLKSIVVPLIDEYVPRDTPGKRSPKLPWKNNPPSSLKRRRVSAWTLYKTNRATFGRRADCTALALQRFQLVNRQLKNFAYTSQVEYERSLISRMKENPKLLHSYIRHKKKLRPAVGPLTLACGDLTDDPRTMADCFVSAFSSVFTTVTPVNPAPHQLNDTTLDQINFTLGDVLEILSNLDANSAMGPDGLHPHLLKCCSSALARPIFMIFSRSVLAGSLPVEWKRSFVVPIFKKGSRYDPLNYRPVSLTSVPCKCLEKLIFRDLYAFLQDNSLLSEHQFGFRPGHSTEDQLLLTYNVISRDVDEGHIVDLILFDFSKAFDIVCHSMLIEKLRLIGVHGQVLIWLKDFLSGRTMQVMVKNTFSAEREVLSGVPQGSVLGPVLFLVYINHVAHNLACDYKIFADDLKIYMCIDSKNPLGTPTQQLQADINQLHATAFSWGLKMNLKKCAVLRFKRRFHENRAPHYLLEGKQIPCNSSQVDLGVTVDEELKFHEHIGNAARKAGAVARNFLKSTVCRDPDFMLLLLKSHIRPLLEYASPVWNTGYIQDVKKLEAIQRLWTRNTRGLENKEYGERLQSLDLFSVKGRLLRADLIKCWKIFHGASAIQPADLWVTNNESRTRGHRYKIKVTRNQVDARARFFSCRIVQDWNSLPDGVVGSNSLSEFKGLLAQTLGQRLYEFYP